MVINSSNVFLRAAGIALIAGLAVIALAAGSEAASFEVSSGTPSAGAPVQFTETSGGRSSAWQWTFGDGSSSSARSPAHVFPAAGIYPVTLKVTDVLGNVTQATLTLEVLPPGTLRLMARTGRSFDVTIVARDPESGETLAGQAVAQGDAFGFFAVPERTAAAPGAPLTPEVFVKMQDARAQGRDFSVFWGGPTDLAYTLTVRDITTGVTKVMRSSAPGAPSGLGMDTSGFLAATAERVVKVGDGGSNFVDSQSGTKTTTVHVGDTVKWTWMSGPHTTTSGNCTGGGGGGYYGAQAQADCSQSGVWNSNSHSAPYEFSRTFTTPGTYTYFCAVHGDAMTGSVVVSADTPETTPTPGTGTATTPAPRETVDQAQERQREPRLVGRPAPNSGGGATATPTAPGATPTPTPTVPGATPTPTPTPPTGATRVVEIRSNFFRDRVSGTPTTMIDVGTTVEWEWESGFHSTTSGACCTGDGKWNSTAKSSGTFDHTFVEADRGRSFPYFCLVHGSMMTGTVVVNP